jgi:site-specific recombinase XerD
MLEVLYGAGLRVSELVGLNWNDVQWSARELRLFGKGSKERVVPLGHYALDALLVFAKHYQERFRKKAKGPLPIFISQWHRRINQRSIPRTIRKWAKQAGILGDVILTPSAIRARSTCLMLVPISAPCRRYSVMPTSKQHRFTRPFRRGN